MSAVSINLALLYSVTTLAKAWEPLSVAIAARVDSQPPFAAVLVVAEAIKFVCALSVANLCESARRRPTMLSRRSAYSFGVPATFLALCNLCLGFAVARLNPILYQVLFKGINALATAILSACRRPLALGQWGTIALLLLGMALTLPDADRADAVLLPRAGDAAAPTGTPAAGVLATAGSAR